MARKSVGLAIIDFGHPYVEGTSRPHVDDISQVSNVISTSNAIAVEKAVTNITLHDIDTTDRSAVKR